jgi:hypothetical protein
MRLDGQVYFCLEKEEDEARHKLTPFSASRLAFDPGEGARTQEKHLRFSAAES